MDLVLSDTDMENLSNVFMQHVEDCDSSSASKRMINNLFKKICEARKRPGCEYSIEISWGVSDIQSVRPDLSKNKCREVLDYLDRKHDANQGINWEVIEIVADKLYPPKD